MSDELHEIRIKLLNGTENYCNRIWVKGMSKSGTTWLTSTLSRIVTMVCNKTYENALKIIHFSQQFKS